MDDLAEDEFCMHELVPAQCSTCNGSQPVVPRSGGGARGISSRPEVMHLVVKWSPGRESNTLEKHRSVAEVRGTTWWGCETSDPNRSAARARIELLDRQLSAGSATVVYLYRLGDSPTTAQVHRTRLVGIADDESRIDQGRRPEGYQGSQCSIYLELTDFESASPSDVRSLEFYDQPAGRPVDTGALGNQTSPMYVLRPATPSAGG